MAKNYFTDEQIRAVILKKLESNGVDITEAINLPSEEAVSHLKEFANLAVETAIGDAVAQVFRHDAQSKIIPNDTFVAIVPHGRINPPQGTKLYSVKELDN